MWSGFFKHAAEPAADYKPERLKKDTRKLTWKELEADIQDRGGDKDEDFDLSGSWKKLVRKQDGFNVYAVDGKWVRDNLSVIFGHGGHGYVHEFIPLDEIWCSTHHYDEGKGRKCGCDKGNEPVSQEYFDSCVAHEIFEFNRMKGGDDEYWDAHQKALNKERELGLLKSPNGDSGKTPLPATLRKKASAMNAFEIVKQAKTLGGFYQGKPASPDTVKKTVDFQGLKIKIDRPKGFIMFGEDSKGTPWERKYKYDYGFIPKTLGGDGDGLDVFIGPNSKATQTYWAVQRNDDGSFDEYKIFVGFDNRDEAIAAYRAHIPKKYFGRLITMSIEMMKAMLGSSPPNEKVTGVKQAQWLGFIRGMQEQL